MGSSNRLKGFTLIELIVVISIIGVLAAIIVPSMIGYTKMARASTLEANAKSAYNSASTAMVNLDAKDETVPSGEIYIGQDSGIARSSSGSVIDISDYFGENFSGCYGFKIASNGLSVECAVWSNSPITEEDVKIYTHDEIMESTGSRGVGSYPVMN